MEKGPQVIGEGAYGCIHKPSIRCGDKHNITYKNKISKVMSKKEAKNELREYRKIAMVDPNRHYFLGKPTLCHLDNSERAMAAIAKCRHGDELLEEMDKLALLVMNDGGYNLEVYADSIVSQKSTPENRHRFEIFWLEAYRILQGIDLLLKHDLLHQDVKAQNLVYQESKHRINFIDFGFMNNRSKILEESRESNNWLSRHHWSYAFEIEFLDKERYDTFAKKTDQEKREFFTKYLTKLEEGVIDRHTEAFRGAFSVLISTHISKTDQDKTMKQFMDDYYKTLMNDIRPGNYDAFLVKAIDTMDLYGAGMAFTYVLNQGEHLLDEGLAADLRELCYSMTTPHLFSRIGISEAMRKYREIFEKHGMLKKHGHISSKGRNLTRKKT